MIAFVRGTIAEKTPQYVVIEAGGVGYLVFITLGCYETLPEVGGETMVHTATIVREDAFLLYGFSDKFEKEMFHKLISVTRVGPKLACGVLSGIKTESLRNAIVGNDKSALSKIPGVGGKTAERIIMELKDKMGPHAALVGLPSVADERTSDAIAALLNLGYQRAQAEKAVAKASDENPGAEIGTIIRKSLKIISG
ncbi:MAG: Holliday junction branch migration protein RuvA [Nitrospinae bacterium]|nr:Holliday junction branch migration protein RuvA [Nitrospinota bacterium]